MRENTDQNNSEYKHFSRSVYLQVFFLIHKEIFKFLNVALAERLKFFPIQEKKNWFFLT